MTPHEHKWRLVAHVDGCHWFATTAACECGATLRQEAERDMNEDPYSVVWLDMTTCGRCAELLRGAPAKPFTEVIVEA